MKKQFKLEIAEPCNQDFSKMDKTQQGFFCNSCVKTVIDLTQKSDYEIAQIIANNKNNHLCARMKTTQLNTTFEINEFQKANNLKSAIAIAATVLLSTNVAAQEPQTTPKEPIERHEIMGKVAPIKITKPSTISFTVKGKITDLKGKPLSKTTYPNLTIYINGAQKEVTVNPKTGEYAIPVTLEKANAELHYNIQSNDFYATKQVTINLKKITKKAYIHNIKIDPKKEFQQIHIAGGLGVIDVPKIEKQ